jgi:hypothetical protein
METSRYVCLFMAFALVACQSPDGGTSGSIQGSASLGTDFSYWTQDRAQRIVTGDESYAQSADTIKQCANGTDGNPLICYDTCISRWFPQNRRYSLYLSGYVPANRCFVTILETPSMDGAPADYEFFEGTYQTYVSGGVTRARCTGVDEGVPDDLATHLFSTYRTPTGQATTNPWGYRVYDLLSLFSTNGSTLLASMYLQTYQTTEGEMNLPGRFGYFESNTSGNELTFTQMNGFGCVKRTEITNAVIQAFQPGQ